MTSRAGDLVKANDGYWDRVVGRWSEDKHHFLKRYLDAFTTAMREKWEIHYIDLFAGPGRCRIRNTDRIVDGSPVIAAKAEYRFRQLHLCDKDSKCADSLKARLAAIPQPTEPEIRCGDANREVRQIMQAIPRKSLSLSFLDPSGLHLHYATLKVLAHRRVDLILFFPDSIDAVRNWKAYYEERDDSNLDKVLGPGCNWREELNKCRPRQVPEKLRELYESQVEKLGYVHRAYERISERGHRLYILIFCSKHEAGLKIWRGISEIQPGGQRGLQFDR